MFQFESTIHPSIKHERLLILSPDNQYLAAFEAPKSGWNPQQLKRHQANFPQEWDFCGANAYLGEKCIGHQSALEESEVE